MLLTCRELNFGEIISRAFPLSAVVHIIPRNVGLKECRNILYYDTFGSLELQGQTLVYLQLGGSDGVTIVEVINAADTFLVGV